MESKLIIRSFYQGKDEESLGAGNCASVALIKAGMYSFGYDLLQYEVFDQTYHVKMKNGDSVEFNSEELEYASRESSFIPGKTEDDETKKEYDKAIDYAHLCFATMCKMAQRYGDYSQRFSKFIIPKDFETAVEIINDGTFTPEVYEFLGLEEHISPVYRTRIEKRVKSKMGSVIWTKSHAMFAANSFFDRYGKPVKLKNRFMLRLPGKFITGLFQVKN